MNRKSPMKIFEKEVGYTLTENARKMLREAAEKEAWRQETKNGNIQATRKTNQK